MASPLVDLATADSTRYQTSLSTNGTALGAAKSAFDGQQTVVATATTTLGADLSALAPLRDALAASPMPADAIALAGEFETLIAKTRVDQAALISAQKAEDQDQVQLTYFIDAVNRATEKVPETQATLDAANAAEAKRAAWVTALGQPPLSTIPNDAQTELDTAGAAAETRLQADIQPELYALAEARYAREVARQQRVQNASTLASALLTQRIADDGGVTEVAAQKTGDYNAAFDAFAGYVGQAPERLARSSAALAAITAAPDLTDVEKTRMTDPAIHDPGVAAAGAVGPIETAVDGIAVAQQGYDDAVLTARATDPEVDVTTVPAVGTAKDALKTAAQGLEDALTAGPFQAAITAEEKAALDAWGAPAVPDDIDDLETMIATMLDAAAAGTADQRKALAAWEATVPDATWEAFVSYQSATADLTALAGFDPSTLSPAVDTAETALATALGAAEESDRAQWLLQEEAKRRGALEAAEAAAGSTRLVSATRGDG